MKIKIYGVVPYFPDSNPRLVENETANMLVKLGRATLEPKKSPWDRKVEEGDYENKADPDAKKRRAKAK